MSGGDLIAPGSLPTLLLITTRIAALVCVAPLWGSRLVPWRARWVLIVWLAAPAYCIAQPSEFLAAGELPRLLLHEAVVGVSLGLAPALMIWGLQAAVQALQGLSGLPGAVSGGALGDDQPHGAPLERFFLITVTAVFVLSGGHRQLIEAVLQSFRWLPPGRYAPLHDTQTLLADLLTQSFALGVRALGPLLAALFISLLAFAGVSRILPQLGYFAVGMNIQVAAVLAALVLFLGAAAWSIESEFSTVGRQMTTAWGRMLVDDAAEPGVDGR